ncbi:LysM peptidoglycan-binding domain-containing protein [Natroniella sulfidigena]|uniref:LysM peptidoglycan-binding domain-containing protein n=1 Tax=Natroniella sulfidigena TaxID=723921 RepID=UPI00200A809A|nr:LysM peptidoglycan-binding domain-containing protein [Natroniella sulfidigena]MCK8817269.1 LysM peptidoglycan-binding domain-containing protein [Natroniella sulfidigena]
MGNYRDCPRSNPNEADLQQRVPDFCPPRFGVLYTVRPEDTMWNITRRLQRRGIEISLEGLIAANPHIPDPDVLFPGDVLCLPEPPPPPPDVTPRVPAECPRGYESRYTVRAGDTMWNIARRFGVSLAGLIRANPHITNPEIIYTGDVLCVPSPF